MNWLEKNHIVLANPEFLWLLLLIPIMIWFLWRKQKKRGVRIQLSSLNNLENYPESFKAKSRIILPILKILALTFFILALSRPQKTNTIENIESEGIDIVLSLDISGSMLAEDFQPNRIEAAKETAIRFIENRPTDRIGLVVFAGESFTLSPITIDKNILVSQTENIKSGMLEDGTAIGMGLATAVDRLRDAKGASKVILLMTDGVNNRGKIDPYTALEIAKAFGIRVYTIGIGTIGEALYPVQTPFGTRKELMPVEIDEPLLKQIAAETGGNYYRATDNESLEKIYDEIDQLEKTLVEISAYKNYKDLFYPFAIAGIIMLSLAMILNLTVYRMIT